MSRMLISFLIAYMLGLPETSSLAALAFSAQSAPQTPSLAELARGQPPRRPGTKVYTNDDLGSPRSSGAAEESAAESGPAAGPPVQAETASATEEEASASEPLPPEEDPTYWRERVEPLQQEIARLEAEIRRLSGMTGTLSPTQTGTGLNLAEGGSSLDPQQRIANLEQRKLQVEAQLAAIVEEARRAGVPPAWVR